MPMQDIFSGVAPQFPIGLGLRSLRGSWGSLARSSEKKTTTTQDLSYIVEENPLGVDGERAK